jgi:pilus assembly protein CpaC
MMNIYPHFLFSVMISLAFPSAAPTDRAPGQGVISSGPSQTSGDGGGAPSKDNQPTTDDFGDFDSDAIYEPASTDEAADAVNEDTTDDVDGDVDSQSKEDAGGKANSKDEPSRDEPQRSGPAKGVSAEPEPSSTVMKMTFHSEQSRPIQLSVNASVAIDLEENIDLAQVASPDIADILVPSAKRVIVVGKSVGSTQLLLRTGDDYASFLLSVTPNYSVLKQMIEAVAPSSRVDIGSLKGQTVLMGRVPDALTSQRIEELAAAFQGGEVINHLSVAGVQQVLLQVVVAEVNKDATRTLGINWGLGGSPLSRDFFLGNNLGQLNPVTFGTSGLADVTQGQQLFALAPNANGSGVNFTFGFPRAELQFFLNALRENSLARTLAEPTLIAISGQTAAFLAGGEVPIPVSQGGAVAGAITIEYKEFGVRLAFTPTVGAGGVIRIHVMTEVSDAIPDARQVGGLPLFTFVTRRVESTIESGNGQSFAIAGLLSNRVNAIASKIPGLGDIPVLGTLFSSVDYQKSRTELVVLVTPQLVEALDPSQVGVPPGVLTTDPTDLELFTLQKLEGVPRALEDTRWAPSAASAEQKRDKETDQKVTANLTQSGLQGPWGIEDPEGNPARD